MTTIYLIGGPYDLTKQTITPDREPPRQYVMTMHPRIPLEAWKEYTSKDIPTVELKHAVYTRGHRTLYDNNVWIYYYEGLEHEVWDRESRALQSR